MHWFLSSLYFSDIVELYLHFILKRHNRMDDIYYQTKQKSFWRELWKSNELKKLFIFFYVQLQFASDKHDVFVDHLYMRRS